MPLIGRDRVDAAIRELAEEKNRQVIAIYTQGLTAVINETPVHFRDGGRLKNNWFLTAGGASRSTRGGSTSGAGSHTSLSNKMPTWVLGKKMFFTNNMPYANVVEYGGYPQPVIDGTWTGNQYEQLSSGGYSRQAPGGMARTNITLMKSRIRRL